MICVGHVCNGTERRQLKLIESWSWGELIACSLNHNIMRVRIECKGPEYAEPMTFCCSNSITLLYFQRLALTAMNKFEEAVTSYQKALDLDPENDSYKSNLKIAEQKLREVSSPVSCHWGRDPVTHN